MEVVYSITNTANSKKYIGSTVEYKKRVRSHLNALRGRYHGNRKLQEDFNKYGEGCFVFEVEHSLGKGESEERFRLEKELIDYYTSYETGYNLSYDGRGKYLISDKTRGVFSKNNSGEGNGFYGKTHTLETKEKLSNLASERIGEKNPFYGKSHTEKTKDMIRQAIGKLYEGGWGHPQKGVPKTNEEKVNNMLGQPKRKEVIVDGVCYPSVSSCATTLSVSRTTIRNRAESGKFPNYYFKDDR